MAMHVFVRVLCLFGFASYSPATKTFQVGLKFRNSDEVGVMNKLFSKRAGYARVLWKRTESWYFGSAPANASTVNKSCVFMYSRRSVRRSSAFWRGRYTVFF